MPSGPVSTFDQAIADEVCCRMASGESLRAICRSEGMPPFQTVYQWTIDHPHFGGQYERARDTRAETIFDEIFEIADDGTNDWMEKQDEGKTIGWRENGEAIRRSALRVDARKWALARMAPKRFGDRLNVDQKTEVTTKEQFDGTHLSKDERQVFAALVAKMKKGEAT